MDKRIFDILASAKEKQAGIDDKPCQYQITLSEKELQTIFNAVDRMDEDSKPIGSGGKYREFRNIIGMVVYQQAIEQGFQIHFKSEPGIFTYLVVIEGGRGPDVWDNETTVQAASIKEAVEKIEAELKGEDAAITYIKQMD
jgi:hypothetical protein